MLNRTSLESLIKEYASLHLININEYSLKTFSTLVSSAVTDVFHEYVSETETSSEYEDKMDKWLMEHPFEYNSHGINKEDSRIANSSWKIAAIIGIAAAVLLTVSSYIALSALSLAITTGISYCLFTKSKKSTVQLSKEQIVSDCCSKLQLWIDDMELASNTVLKSIYKQNNR